MNLRQTMPGAVSAALFGISLCVRPTVSWAACEPAASPGSDTIVCTGTDTEGVLAGSGHDRVTVDRAATVALQVAAARAAIDAGSGNDIVVNNGLVSMRLVLASGAAQSMSAGHCPAWKTDASGASGIRGASGADTITNAGTVTVSSLFQATTAASTLSGSMCIVPAGAFASGLEGNDGTDQIVNHGALTVTATVEKASTATASSTAFHNTPPPAPAPAMDAIAVGIAGGTGGDDLRNEGTLGVSASSTLAGSGAQATGISTDDGASIGNRGRIDVTATTTDAGAATAAGLAGGNGRNVFDNTGTINVTSTATQGGFTPHLSLAGGDDVTETTTVESRAVGIDAGNGKDQVFNSGTLNATATSKIDTVDVTVALIDLSHADTTTTVRATAIGIDAGRGADGVEIRNSGTINASATSTISSVDVEVTGADAAQTSSGVTVEANATGIAGGNGRDRITNAGTIKATATADVLAVGVTVNYVDATVADRKGSDATTTLTATATGIDAGKGRDALTITHDGSVEATATATVKSIGVGLGSEGVPDTIQDLIEDGKLASLDITAGTVARGIVAGSGSDKIASGGDITTTATSNASQTTVSVGISAIDLKIPTPGIGLASAGTKATADARGIDGGAGDDEITTSGKVTTGAGATASATTVNVSIAGLSIDLAEGLPGIPFGTSLVVSDTETLAEATATGIAAGDGNDKVTNLGTVKTGATAEGGSTSASANFNLEHGKPDKPEDKPASFFAVNAIAARGTTTANATAVGIDGGSGRDELRNLGTVTTDATAHGHAVAIGIDVAGTLRGQGGAISAALTDTSTEATATSTGIQGGTGDDSITNDGAIGTTATASVDSVSVSNRIGIVNKGLVAGAALARAETIATATAVGIDGGDGSDTIVNRNSIGAKADADAVSVAVSATIDGTARGIEGSAALVDTSAQANATAVGIRTGSETARQDLSRDGGHDGHDGGGCHPCDKDPLVINTGAISADADANTNAVSVGGVFGIAKEGLALGAALADASSTSTALATGIQADARNDQIGNHGSIGLRSVADADAVSVSVTLEGTAKGLAAGAALVDASVNATARATGIAAGDGDDLVVNTGSITSQSIHSTATAVGVATSVLVAKEGAGIGASLGRTSATALAGATGVDGGEGDDKLYNTGGITLSDVKADADAVTVSVQVALAKEGLAVGAALADSTSTATVETKGLEGGKGDDLVVNEGDITLQQSAANAKAVSVSVTLAGAKDGVAIGAALVDADATASLAAAGLSGGAGRDTLVNTGNIKLDDLAAKADATSVGVGFTFANQGVSVAAALAETGATARATASGIDGGEGDDVLINEGGVTLANVRAAAGAVSVTAGLAGANSGVAISAALADASGTANAVARGMDGGTGDDLVVNHGRLTATGVTSRADAASITVDISGANSGVAAGASLADTSANATTDVKGIDGGDGHDELWNKGTIEIGQAKADAQAVSVAVSLKGAMNGVAAGAALGRADSTAEARATGIDGGKGNDWVANKGTITIDGVEANTDSKGVSAQLGLTNAGVAIGAALVDTKATSRASATGLDGGEGNDDVVNAGTLALKNVKSDADAVSVGVTINAAISGGVAAGVALTDASGKAETQVTGLAGGAGDDTLVNLGTVRIDNAEANAHATGVSVTVSASMAGVAGGFALADTSATATTRVTGLDGGEGNDTLLNKNLVEVQGKAQADAKSIAVQVGGAFGVAAGAAMTDASTTATSTVTGIDGGAGRDEILNEGTVKALAETVASSASISVSGNFGIGAGVAVADARSTATSSAIGIHAVGVAEEPCRPHPHDGAGSSMVRAQWNNGGHDGGHDDDDCKDGKPKHHDDIDTIVNRGSVTATATARATGASVSVSLQGYALGETTSTATANAIGIQTEDSRDVVQNVGSVTVTSSATGAGAAIGVALLGRPVGDASTTAIANATGVDTGARDDEIANFGTLSVDARSNATAGSLAVGFIGASSANASTTSTATAYGIAAGEGDDRVHNGSVITVAAGLPAQRDGTALCSEAAGGACALAGSASAVLIGAASADASSTATASAVGIDGGNGDDEIDNDGRISATSLARARADGVGVSLVGATSVNGTSLAGASAAGLAGAAGEDHLVNRGAIDVHAAAETYTRGVSFNLVGATNTEGNTLTRASATGIDGGADGDAIGNAGDGTITVKATTQSTVTGSAWSFVGGASAQATLGAFTSAAGIAGGGGADRIYNGGSIDVATTSTLNATGGGRALFGNARAGSRVTADAAATGIDGGEGDDAIRNTGTIGATAQATLSSNATSFAFAGGAATTEVLVAAATATGIAGGEGRNEVFNEGRIDATASTSLVASGGASSSFGDANAAATVAARTTAIGIGAGAGSDLIVNDEAGRIEVGVTAQPATDNGSSGGLLFVDGVTRSTTTSTSRATGIDAGDGRNHVINRGGIGVTLTGTTTAKGDSDSGVVSQYLGVDSDSYAFSTASLGNAEGNGANGPSALAIGIRAGEGGSRLANVGSVEVTATPGADATARGFGNGIISADGTADAKAFANDVQAIGLRAGAGDNAIYNGGSITVTARPVANAYAYSDADGIDAFAEPDSKARTEVAANRTVAIGIDAATGKNVVVNDGSITVTAAPQASKAQSFGDYGGDVLGIDGFATSIADANGTLAIGIRADGDGSIVLNKSGARIDVTAAPAAITDAWARGVGSDGDASAVAQATADGTRALGIQVNGADARVINDGTVGARTDAYALGKAVASPSGTGEVESYAERSYVRDAQAIGIGTTGAHSGIENNGSVDAIALATADLYSSVAVDAQSSSRAVGLQGLGAGSRIDNTGTVRARAEAWSDRVDRFQFGGLSFWLGISEAHATAIGIEGGDGGNRVLNTGVIEARAVATGTTAAGAEAYGIRTGSGNDIVINRGTITATQIVNGVATPGTAISTGAGDDELVLGDGSVTNGTIDLGLGSNTLTLEGSPIINGPLLDGQTGLTLQFLNDGNYAGALPGVIAIKDGPGTFTLSMLNPMQKIDVRRGTLYLTHDYAFVQDGTFAATVWGDGSNGAFRIGGAARLGGSMSVQRGGGAYRDGTRYDVLLADGGIVAGSTFDRIELPDPARLLSFNAQQLDDRIRIEASVRPFVTAALTPNQQAIAGNFDRLLPTVKGDLNKALGTIQALNTDAEFATAFASLSPAVHEHYSRASLAATRQHGQTMQDRLGALQVAEAAPAAGAAGASVAGFDAGRASLAAAGTSSADRASLANGLWMKGFAQRGKQDATGDASAYDHRLAGATLGYDRRFGDSFVAGFSLGRASNTVKADIDRSDADITSRMVGAYASWFDQRAYVNATLSSGRNDYDTNRTIVVGASTTPVASRHRGDVLAASLGAGTLMRAGSSWLDPFFTLNYVRLKEDGFREEGSGAALIVGERTTTSLVSTLGVRWLRVFGANGEATWAPEASLAWLHDFDRGGHLVNAAYVDAPDASFSIAGQPVEKNGLVGGLGVTYRSGRGLATFLRYKGEVRSHYTAHSVIGEVRYEF